MLRLVVKGDKHAAAKAAADRGIPFAFRREVKTKWIRETHGLTSDEHHDKVAEWFTEPIAAVKGEGFPVGSLLLFTVVKD